MSVQQESIDVDVAGELLTRLRTNIGSVIQSKRDNIDLLLTAFIAGGHVLLEDVPGTGKTTLAKALAGSIQATFKRVQFTPDLLPSDILGVSIYNQQEQAFQFRPGPIFTQVLLADEINRASPRTQSALLEAMGEGQVSVEGDRLPMDELFFVIATQNPIEFHGTYPLPEAQMDRFAMRFSLGYVSREEEIAILDSIKEQHPIDNLSSCMSTDEVRKVRAAARDVRLSDELKGYIVDIVAATRSHPGIQLGASPRAGITLMQCSQALALIRGMSFVTPETIQELAQPTIAHRIVLADESQYAGEDPGRLMAEILGGIPVPA